MGSHIIYSMLWYVPIPTIYFNPVFIGLPPVLLQQYCSSVLNTLTVLSHGSISCILTALHGNHACICLDMPQRDHLVLVSCPVFSPPLTPVCCDWQFAPVSTDKFQLNHTVAVRQIGIIHHHYQYLCNNITPFFTSCHISMQLIRVPILYLVLHFTFFSHLFSIKYPHCYTNVKNLKT